MISPLMMRDASKQNRSGLFKNAVVFAAWVRMSATVWRVNFVSFLMNSTQSTTRLVWLKSSALLPSILALTPCLPILTPARSVLILGFAILSALIFTAQLSTIRPVSTRTRYFVFLDICSQMPEKSGFFSNPFLSFTVVLRLALWGTGGEV